MTDGITQLHAPAAWLLLFVFDLLLLTSLACPHAILQLVGCCLILDELLVSCHPHKAEGNTDLFQDIADEMWPALVMALLCKSRLHQTLHHEDAGAEMVLSKREKV